MSNLTPMLRQYHELKKQHPGTLLFFRLGDFYELFYEDAQTGARELEIALTARNKERNNPVPMCGVPHHAAASYIVRLVRKGYRVAICEQTEDAAQSKKLIRREVVRIITPGTIIDPQLIEPHESIYLAAVCGTGDTLAAAFLDVSTGDFRVTQACGTQAWARIKADLEAYAPRELIFPTSLAQLFQNAYAHGAASLPLQTEVATQRLSTLSDAKTVDRDSPPPSIDVFNLMTLTPIDDDAWRTQDCASLLCEQFGVRTLDGYGLAYKTEAVRAAGACLRYARETQRVAAAHITEINYFEPQDHLVLDSVTVRNLELIPASNNQDGHAHALLDVIDETRTGMGSRTLRTWLLRPSIRRAEIEARLGAVDELHRAHLKRDHLRARLKEVADLERLMGRLNMNTISPRDLLALLRSLEQVPQICQALSDAESSLLQILYEKLDELTDACSLIKHAISDDAPAKLTDGGVVREGYSTELDELRSISRNAKQTIAALEARERSRSGISSLRVRFNGVFGYFIEVSKASAARVPADYERRQTLSNAERFTTPELKEWERRVLGAEDHIAELETKIFKEVCEQISAHTKRIQATARAFASLDALAGLAEVAVRRRYVRPLMHETDEIEIVAGRHPMIEASSDEHFIPNDLYMNNSMARLLIITGPNMGGKSTVLRQTALISILAQMGSFVPAERARLPVLDRIFTRVGANDDLARGRSTFMVEMTETAQILHHASARSLVLLDEIGRGTATFDGLSIAWAVAEYLHDSAEHAAKTLFATHYHELTELAERLPGAQNYQITATERDGEVVFLHKLERGRASKSYGIEVARLAGLPSVVLARAREVLTRLERYELDVFAEEMKETTVAAPAQEKARKENNGEALEEPREAALGGAIKRANRRRIIAQATLFEATNQSLLDELRNIEVETLQPEEARQMLQSIRARIM